MREIKFRAWDKEERKMVADVWVNHHAVSPDFNTLDNERYIPMQFTGLKDKNGKEIYEGDILKEKGLKKPFVVKWDQDVIGFTCSIPMGKAIHWAAAVHFKESEVIGNVYENPELLKA